ncbi:MAG: peptidoglycan-associated lipoprotein Pal [Candidatus Rokuibacteriota bacterium]
MQSRRWSGMVVLLLVLALVVAGCAKRPATTVTSAPAPGGGARSAPDGTGTGTGAQPSAVDTPTTRSGPATSAPAGAGQTPVATQPGGAAPAGVAAPAGGATTRVEPRDFVAVPDLKDIYFDFDKYDVRPSDAKVLDGNAAWLKTNANMLVLIEGHCDERGTNEYNLALGERRAKSAMNYLVSQGVQGSRITIISYGEERPVCTEKNEACWAKNRRAHFLVKPR